MRGKAEMDPWKYIQNGVTIVALEKQLWQKFKGNEHLLTEFKSQFKFTEEDIEKMAFQNPTDLDYIKCLASLAIILPAHAQIEPEITTTPKYELVQKTVRDLINA